MPSLFVLVAEGATGLFVAVFPRLTLDPARYSPRSLKELGEVRRHAPKNEGFGSARGPTEGGVLVSSGCEG